MFDDVQAVDLYHPDKNMPDWDGVVPWYDYQLAEHGGQGLLTQYGAMNEVNFECCEFIAFQFERWGLPTPDADLIEWCWNFAFYAVDQIDPYLWFGGYTDVVKADDTCYFQFSVREDLREDFREIGPEHLEYFEHAPEVSQRNFPKLYNSPTLKNFDMIYDYFQDHMSFGLDGMHESAYSDEIKFFRRYGNKAAVDWMELGVWAAMIWLISPTEESRNWRYSFHPIFQLCYDAGSCILNDWTFYEPGYYMKHERPAKSCATCGTHEWCVELTQVRGKNTEHICQSCLSEGEPFPGATCGSKFCDQVKCINHPAHDHAKSVGMNRAQREIAADRRFGSMHQLPWGEKTRELPGMVYINTRVMEAQANSIANDMGDAFQKLLGSLD